MMKTYISVYLSILFTFLLFFVSAVPIFSLNAQSNSVIQPTIELPSVALNSLLMDEYVYVPGKEVKMTLDIENISASPSEFRYKVEILPTDATQLSTSSAQTILSASKFSERYVLRPKEARKLDITYLIPNYAKGMVVLKISAINDAGFEVYSKTLSLLDARMEGADTESSSDTSTVVNSIDIKKIVFQQGKNIFEPKGEGSSYLLDETADLDIEVSTDGRTDENALILAELRNTHTGSTTESVQGVNSRGKSIARMQLKTMSLPAGVYELTITPISPDKKQIGPSKKISVGIEGIVAVIQSLNLNVKLPVKKGDAMYLSAYWVPVLQISKELTEDLVVDSKFNKPFTAKIFIENESGDQISSSTMSGATPEIFTELKAVESAKNVFGRIEIWIEDEMIGSYKKELQLEPLNGQGSDSKIGFGDYTLIALVLAIVISLIIFIRKRKIKMQSVGTSILLISIIVPQLTFAQWTQFSTTSLTHLFPKDPYGDLSTTTWRQVNNTSGGYNPSWPAIVPYSRSNCQARTAATGVSSNYVAQTLPLISGNNKMYRWEHSFYPIVQGGNIWYWVNKNTYADGTTWPSTGVIPGVFSKSAFINESHLDKLAAYTDNLSTIEALWQWRERRPIRLNATNGMGTNVVSALATTTYSNLTQWINAWFNVEESRAPAYSRYFENFGAEGSNGIEGIGLGSASVAVPADSYVDTYEYAFTSSNLAARKTALGITNNTYTLTSVDAGGFLKGMNTTLFGFEGGTLSGSSSVEQESLPGTYRLFNFLYTARDEVDLTLVTGQPQYPCFSANLQVWRNSYEVVGNSYVDVVLFYDENEDGIKQDTEYPIADHGPVNGGYPITIYNGGIYNTSCPVPAIDSQNLMSPNFYRGHVTKPIHRYQNSYADGKYFAITLRTAAQVTPLAYIDSSQINRDMSNYSYWGNETAVNQVYYWATKSFRDVIAKYDNQGRLNVTTDKLSQVCGQTINSYADSDWINKAYEIEVRDYPVPPSIANNTTVYWKLPINSEVSTQYVIDVDRALLPTGWATTTSATTTVIAAGSQNQHIPVYFGVKYTGNGVCGSATTTLSGPATAPSTNLCSIGQASAPAAESQRYIWDCLGIGGGTDASCVKQKCPTSNPYYCAATNSCVADINACSVSGVCGFADREEGQSNAGNPPYPPDNFLCDAGAASPVAGEGLPFAYHTWSCFGTNGGTTASCDRPKCSNGLVYCSTLNECRTECPTTGTSTLIFDATLSPRIVRNATDQCIFSWKTSSSEDLPVSCELDGVSLGAPEATIQRSSPVSVGSHTLSCTNGEQNQSTTTRCLLNPSYKEI